MSQFVSVLKEQALIQALSMAAATDEPVALVKERFVAEREANGLPLKSQTKGYIASEHRDSVRAEKLLPIIENFAAKELNCDAAQFDAYMGARLEEARRLITALKETKRENQDNLDNFKVGLEKAKSSKDDWQVIADRNAEIAMRYEQSNDALLRQRRVRMTPIRQNTGRKMRIGAALVAPEEQSLIQKPTQSTKKYVEQFLADLFLCGKPNCQGCRKINTGRRSKSNS